MKNRHFFFAILLLGSTATVSSALAQDKSASSLEACVAASKRATEPADAAMVCLTTEQNKLSAELDALYSSRLAALPEDRRKLLAASQDAWRRSVEADTLLHLEFTTESDGTTLTLGPVYLRLYQISQRIRLLRSIVDGPSG